LHKSNTYAATFSCSYRQGKALHFLFGQTREDVNAHASLGAWIGVLLVDCINGSHHVFRQTWLLCNVQ